MNQQRLLRLRRAPHLLVTPTQRLSAKRTPTRSTPKPSRPNAWWGVDMTPVLVQGFGWLSIVVVLDWYTNALVGDSAGMPSQARDWLTGLDMAVNGQGPAGIRGQGLPLMRENGGQPTATALMGACGTLGIQQALPSDHHPQGHADAERGMRPRKEECLGLTEWTGPLELSNALAVWMADDTEPSLHAALGYKPPRQFERDYHTCHSTPFAVA